MKKGNQSKMQQSDRREEPGRHPKPPDPCPIPAIGPNFESCLEREALARVSERIGVGVVILDREFRIRWHNRVVRDLFGGVNGQLCHTAFHRQETVCANCPVKRVFDTGAETCTSENKGLDAAGEEAWAKLVASPIRGPQGDIVGALELIWPITDRKRTEATLLRQNAYLEALHTTSLGIIRRLDIGDLLQTLVDHATRLAGTPDGFIYLHDGERDDFELKAAIGTLTEHIGHRFSSGSGLAGAIWKTGRSVMVPDYRSWSGRSPNPLYLNRRAAMAVPLKTGDHLAGLIGLAHYDPKAEFDPDKLTLLERLAELASIALDNARLYSRMKQDLAERKRLEVERAQMEAQLRQSQKMEAIGTLAGGVAHDFNNLLMGIQGNVSLLLLETPSGAEAHNRLKSIERCVGSGAHLTKQLLGFAREGKYMPRQTNLNDMVAQTADIFGRTRKEITIHTRLQKDLWSVEGDRGQMEQVLINLYVNAWQAMPQGGDLHLETHNAELDRREARRHGLKPGHYVKIAVRDTGVGIDDPIRERVFEPFFTTKEVGKGTGLGLASAFGIIKNHGGIIDFASEKGRGTTFYFYLPALRELVPVEKPAVETLVKGTGTILLVDDETIILEAVHPMLEQMGYTVWTAANGREALGLFEKKNARIDLVILDMVMPDIDGGEVFDRMKIIRPDVKVLLSSGYSLSGRATQIMERGCDGFIQKPFSMRSLSREIKTILDR